MMSIPSEIRHTRFQVYPAPIMEEVNLFPTTIYVFHHNDNAIDTEVEGIPDDPDILSHISRNARADIKTGSHNGMKI
ncbi:MAG: hypothetical protein CM15mV13_2380 [uncultured marine virus]|nr:MAG: hypothetical protein CM15mV13_2380 [uncultured marine virus]